MTINVEEKSLEYFFSANVKINANLFLGFLTTKREPGQSARPHSQPADGRRKHFGNNIGKCVVKCKRITGQATELNPQERKQCREIENLLFEEGGCN